MNFLLFFPHLEKAIKNKHNKYPISHKTKTNKKSQQSHTSLLVVREAVTLWEKGKKQTKTIVIIHLQEK